MSHPIPPLATLRMRFHYNPLTGAITYAQDRGPRKIGDPAGSTQKGYPCLFVDGRQHKAAPIAWALYHGEGPGPQHIHPIDGNPCNLKLSNLVLRDEPFTRPNHLGYKRARKPAWHRQIRYSQDEGIYRVFHNNKMIGKFSSKHEALDAKRKAMKAGEGKG